MAFHLNPLTGLLDDVGTPLALPLGVGSGGTGTSTVFTAGSVVYAGVAGVYSQDNSNFFWDATNQRQYINSSAHSATAGLVVSPKVSTDIGLIVKGAASQSADLQEWQNSSGTVLTSISSGGNIVTGGNLHLNNESGNYPYFNSSGAIGFTSLTHPSGRGMTFATQDQDSYLFTNSSNYNVPTIVISGGTGASSVSLVLKNAASQTADLLQLQNSSATVLSSFSNSGLLNKYNSVATVGWGVPAIYGRGRSTAQTTAVASVATYTVGAADGSFIVSANVNVTTSSAENFTVTVAYTDETNTARTLTLNFSLVTGTIGTAITFGNGAVPYEGIPMHIRCKASTAITIATTGTFTGATYNVEGLISQIA